MTATLRSLEAGSPGDPTSRGRDDRGRRCRSSPTRSPSARSKKTSTCPSTKAASTGTEALVFPGLRQGEHLESQVELAPRAPILAADGSPLAEGPAEARAHPLGSAAIDVSGEVGTAEEDEADALARQGFPPGTPVGVSGLERAFNARLAGKPGGSLLAVTTRMARRGRSPKPNRSRARR